jgi:hypothetical protein
MDYLVEQIRAIEPKLDAYQQLGLPMQVRGQLGQYPSLADATPA